MTSLNVEINKVGREREGMSTLNSYIYLQLSCNYAVS